MEQTKEKIKLVFARSIVKREFRRWQIPPNDLRIILHGFQKGIFTSIKGSRLPVNSRLVKIYATTVSGARRIVILVNVATGDGFFLFYRSKNDSLGKNISVQNPLFRAMLHKYLLLLTADIAEENFQEYLVISSR